MASRCRGPLPHCASIHSAGGCSRDRRSATPRGSSTCRSNNTPASCRHSGKLICRRGADVVSMRPDSLTEVGRVQRGAGDLWVLSSWLPRGFPAAPTAAAVAAAESTGTSAEGPLYVQVSTSQNPEWSGHLADDLTRAGLAARVLPPQHPDEGYRVVLGPYSTREQAEAIGRRLGRPFWIYQPGQ